MASTDRALFQFIDTHCHFDFPPFVGFEHESLQLAAGNGVSAIVVPAVTADRFAFVAGLAARFPSIYAALGLHPLYIAQHGESELASLELCLLQSANELAAMGEIGLDLYMDDPNIERQLWLLREQLKLAKHFDLPVILHSRRTHDVLARELKRANLPRTGVVHGFSGSLEQALAFIRLGYAIGVGGTISYPRAQKTRAVMAALPLEALLLETDAPDMPLMGFQGEPNRPERIRQVFDVLCELRPNESPQLIAETVYQNSLRVLPALARA